MIVFCSIILIVDILVPWIVAILFWLHQLQNVSIVTIVLAALFLVKLDGMDHVVIVDGRHKEIRHKREDDLPPNSESNLDAK